MRSRTHRGFALFVRGAACLTLILVVSVAALPADVKARHVETSPEETEFRSPMEVEGVIVIPGRDPARSDRPVVSVREFAQFTCEDVSLKELTIKVREPRKGKSGLPVEVTAHLFTRKSHDRRRFCRAPKHTNLPVSYCRQPIGADASLGTVRRLNRQ